MPVVHAPSGASSGMPWHPVLAARAVSPELWRRDAPDDHWVVERQGVAVARASLWWRHVPVLPGETVGLVGHYAAADAEAGATVLRHVTAELASHGCSRAIGPIDGSTWHAYRLVTARGTEPPYFLEPDTPDDWPGHFTAAGFDVLAEYTSSLVPSIPPSSPAMAEVAARLKRQGASPNFVERVMAGVAEHHAGRRRARYVHAKIMLIDDAWATIGSCNLHFHSLGGNAEMNASIWDAEIVRALRCTLLAQHLAFDTAGLDDRAALRLFKDVAAGNRDRIERREDDWQGLAFALSPHDYARDTGVKADLT